MDCLLLARFVATCRHLHTIAESVGTVGDRDNGHQFNNLLLVKLNVEIRLVNVVRIASW
jgi:hypothetical protein